MKITCDGIIAFHISVHIDVNDLRHWSPERIAALFAGIAQAKAAAEPPSRLPTIPPERNYNYEAMFGNSPAESSPSPTGR